MAFFQFRETELFKKHFRTRASYLTVFDENELIHM